MLLEIHPEWSLLSKQVICYIAKSCMEYNARVSNHKYIQHEGKVQGLYVLDVYAQVHLQSCLWCINWHVAYKARTDHLDTLYLHVA